MQTSSRSESIIVQNQSAIHFLTRSAMSDLYPASFWRKRTTHRVDVTPFLIEQNLRRNVVVETINLFLPKEPLGALARYKVTVQVIVPSLQPR